MASSFKDSSIARYGREFFTAKNARRKFPIVNWITTYRFTILFHLKLVFVFLFIFSVSCVYF